MPGPSARRQARRDARHGERTCGAAGAEAEAQVWVWVEALTRTLGSRDTVAQPWPWMRSAQRPMGLSQEILYPHIGCMA